ncbi:MULTISPECIES: hypothetical protein [Streptomyces]|nr:MULTISPECIES: hypothetical protein [Streptomyces]WSK14027.1 hypothetical protein OG717_21065 [Streptomyces celluloflavus]
MENTAPAAKADGTSQGPGLVKARRNISAARERGVTPSDGGGTGRTDSND